MYKDKDKQREADRARQQRRRDVIKSKGVTNTECDGQGVTGQDMLHDYRVLDKPEGYIGAVPCAPPILEPNLKRGKDIKCFADLPPDVQQTIDTLSNDEPEHKRRTAVAIIYQHQHQEYEKNYHGQA